MTVMMMMMRWMLCIVALLLSIGCVCVAAEAEEKKPDSEGMSEPLTQATHTGSEVSSGRCEGTVPSDGSCTSKASPEKLGTHAPPGPRTETTPHSAPRSQRTTQGDDAAERTTDDITGQKPKGEEPAGDDEKIEEKERVTHGNNPQPGPSSSLSPEQPPHDGSSITLSIGESRQIDRVTQGSQEENRNKETNTARIELPKPADSTEHSSPDTPQPEPTPSDPHSGDSNTLNNQSAEPSSTADTLTISEESEGTNGETANAVSESTTTTTTTTTFPPETANNKKSDADSTSSISSSVWVRLPLLIVALVFSATVY
ncbi:uncharacterized protein TM35_000731120 [Trypanosoma theileri]|uniref:Mucin TcMUCII n=1 Tax=Trypanosoma theileri TaxID=67003 RepID=A0A1X0NFT8_9TRYP|nr:uncharacterized protein TM35_000731120 [Trypanosoma theileri]ORC83388.1 hypothetical protein TM35_000731120 [Trypanosoma theileri]